MSKAENQENGLFIAIGGDKGGVGKSMLSQSMADYFLRLGKKVAIIEADTRNPDVARMLEKHAPSLKANLRSEEGWMDIVNFFSEHPGYIFILNTPAGVGEDIANELTGFSRFLKSQELPVEMQLFWAMMPNYDSVNLLEDAYNRYGSVFSKIRIVCNTHFSDGKEDAFLLWKESSLRTKLEKKGAQTLFFPGLHPRVVGKVMNPNTLMPFSIAADIVSGESVNLNTAERYKLNEWLASVTEKYDLAFAA